MAVTVLHDHESDAMRLQDDAMIQSGYKTMILIFVENSSEDRKCRMHHDR